MYWKILPKKSNDLIEQLLINRGIKDKEQFFNPKIADYQKDLQIPGIEKAIKRIIKAIDNNQLIFIFGDYDVDGICAATVLYKGLTSLGAKVLPYIPHREKEGYGLSKMGLEIAKNSGAAIVITVDCGIVSFEHAKTAKALGLDLIITDHHLPQDKLPDAFAIVHSTKMCGAAVAWCLIRNLTKNLSLDLLQFVAIATVCDLIPLIGLGRAFAFEGLKILNRTTNIGLLALINQSGINLGKIGSFEIGYIVGPRLNAMGRLEHAMDSLRLLCTKDPLKAQRLAKLSCEINAQRQQMTSLAVEQAKALVDSKKKIHILYSKQWSIGIIGLIAGRITEEYYSPSIAISQGEDISKGSARSVDGINIVELIKKQKDLIIEVGGHPGAAGFTIRSEYIEIFKRKLEEDMVMLPKLAEKILEIDAEIKLSQVNAKLIQDLKRFEPFGFGNPRPLFLTRKGQVSDIKTVGDGKHLKFKADGIDAIAFGMGSKIFNLQLEQPSDIVFTPEINKYNGLEKLQLKIKDIKII